MAWRHLLLDLHGCDRNSLNDEKLVRGALKELSDIMGLHIIAGPIIVHYVGREGSLSGEGLSGFVIVAESHVSIHTDIRTGYASIDVYSCKEFDIESIEEYLRGEFKPSRIHKKTVLRGPEIEEYAEIQPPK
ncbi:MAG: S-adenosylmethionine decarboxylase [Nitrososphaeria archaeon]|nr:S-adenosylmethionine decarboxylase [Nitrososphaeria archaeon]